MRRRRCLSHSSAQGDRLRDQQDSKCAHIDCLLHGRFGSWMPASWIHQRNASRIRAALRRDSNGSQPRTRGVGLRRCVADQVDNADADLRWIRDLQTCFQGSTQPAVIHGQMRQRSFKRHSSLRTPPPHRSSISLLPPFFDLSPIAYPHIAVVHHSILHLRRLVTIAGRGSVDDERGTEAEKRRIPLIRANFIGPQWSNGEESRCHDAKRHAHVAHA